MQLKAKSALKHSNRVDLPRGEYAKELEADWHRDLCEQLTELYREKQWLDMGIYSSPQHEGKDKETATSVGEKADLDPLKPMENFKFSLPIMYGYDGLLMEEAEFGLPLDIQIFADSIYQVRGG